LKTSAILKVLLSGGEISEDDASKAIEIISSIGSVVQRKKLEVAFFGVGLVKKKLCKVKTDLDAVLV